MEYILYYLLGIFTTFVVISIGLLFANEYDEDTIGPVFIASIMFPITLMIIVGIVILCIW